MNRISDSLAASQGAKYSERWAVLSRWAWVPVPLLFVGLLILHAANLQQSFESWGILFALSFLFSTVAAGVVSILLGRSILRTGAPELLCMGIGVLIWGAAGPLGPVVLPNDSDGIIASHNLLVWCFAFFQLAGVVVSWKPRRRIRWPGVALTLGYASAVGVITLVTVAVAAGWTPVFFVQGRGGTPVRHAVLGSAVALFCCTAGLLWIRQRRAPSLFVLWYAPGLLLIATGLFGLLVQSVHGGWVGWTSRAAQWLGSAYMVVAALASVRESGALKISLEAAVRESEERYRGLVELSPDAILIIREDRIAFVNPAALRLFGATRTDQLRGKSPFELFHSDYHDVIAECSERLLAGGSVPVMEQKLVRLDGKVLDVEAAAGRFEAEGGRALQVIVRDITERKQTEEALRNSEERFRALAENIPQLAWMTDGEGGMAWCNKRWVDYTGATFEQARGWGWKAVHHPEHLERVTAKFRRALETGQPWEDTFPLRGKDGNYRWFLSRAFPLGDAGGKTVRWFGSNTDITELRQAQEALRAAQERLQEHATQLENTVDERTAELREAMGELEAFSYSIAHDMRAPLRAMHGFANILQEECAEQLSADGKDYLSRIARSAKRLDSLIQDVLNYSKILRVELKLEPVDPTAFIREIIESYPNLHPPLADIRVENPLPKVLANPAALTQIFANLLGNAVKFVTPGTRPLVRIRSEMVRAPMVRLWFEDNGIGIDKELQARIFVMFQRLHPHEKYEGTGIGLTIVRKAVERMGGSVGVESEPGRGSRFWIELREAKGVEAPAEPAARSG